jgi:hypothetical protein
MSDERLIRHVETGNDRGQLTVSASWWDEFHELKGARLHGRDLFHDLTALQDRAGQDGDESDELPELTEIVIRLRVNTGTYASAEHIMTEIGDSLGWLAFDHDAIYDARWQQVPAWQEVDGDE